MRPQRFGPQIECHQHGVAHLPLDPVRIEPEEVRDAAKAAQGDGGKAVGADEAQRKPWKGRYFFGRYFSGSSGTGRLSSIR